MRLVTRSEHARMTFDWCQPYTFWVKGHVTNAASPCLVLLHTFLTPLSFSSPYQTSLHHLVLWLHGVGPNVIYRLDISIMEYYSKLTNVSVCFSPSLYRCAVEYT